MGFLFDIRQLCTVTVNVVDRIGSGRELTLSMASRLPSPLYADELSSY